jgi:alkyl hydroperoxide reductase subunit AhpC
MDIFKRGMRYIVFLLIAVSHANSQSAMQSIAPNFSLKDIDGNNWSSDKHFTGKFTIVLFWATWGNDSIEMIDTVEELRKRYQAQGLEAVGVCVEQQTISDTLRARIIETIKTKRLSFPIIFDDQLRTFRQYNVIAVPTTFVIDEQGKIVYHLSGFTIVGREQMFEFVREHFEGKRNITVQHKFSRQPDKHALRLYNMATMKLSRSELDTAKKYAHEAVAIDTGFVEPLILLTEIALEESNIVLAEKNISAVLRIMPGSMEAQSLSGLIAAKQGDTTRALDILKKVLQQSDTIAIAHCYLGYLFGITGNLNGSDEEMKRATELSPSDYRIPMVQGDLLEKAGKITEAKALKKKAKQIRRKR